MTVKKIIPILIFVLAISIVSTCLAAGDETTTSRSLMDKKTGGTEFEGDVEKGTLTLNDFTIVAVRASEIILGVVGSLALLAFIAGGLMFLLSGGNIERVAQGKQIIFGAVIGLVIVFASYAIIQFVFTALNIQIPANSSWSTSGWFK